MLTIAVGLLAVFTPIFASHDLQVDLGYQVNQGQAVVNDTLITFRNIRYAAPPTGTSRFNPPTAPSVNHTGIQNATDVICPQAYPKWLTSGAVTPFTKADLLPIDPRTSEDCLFLDVLLPKGIWASRQHSRAPVLVWIHGGGFVLGWKDMSGQGYGLVTRSQQYGGQGLILVSINYRLGLFGWMNGKGVTSNVGLLDQRLALEWVQKYIHLFGGDPFRVTVIGESAGGGSIEAHITAYGGTKGTSLFSGAIPQSPKLLPTTPLPNSMVDAVLSFGGIPSIDKLRDTSSAALQELNALLIGNSQPYGTFTFGIVPDGDYVPELPGKLLEQGLFNRSVSVMTGHNQDEGSRFVPSSLITNDTSYADFITSIFTPLKQDPTSLNSLTQTHYPPIFNGSQGYTTQPERTNLTIADSIYVCNTHYLNQAPFHSPAYSYEFSIAPAIHGADLSYTFYDFGNVPRVNSTVAEIMQGYFARFAMTGQPNDASLPKFLPAKQSGRVVQHIGNDFIAPILEEIDMEQLQGERCRFWQEAEYLRSG